MGRRLQVGLAATLVALMPTLAVAEGPDPLAASARTADRLRATLGDGRRTVLRGSMLLREDVADTDGSIGGDVRAAIRRSPSVWAALEGAEASGHRVQAARGAMLPSLALLADLDNDEGRGARRRASLGASLSVPIFASGGHLARLRAARASRDAADYGVLARERAVALEAVTATLAVSEAESALRALRENLAGMRLLLDSARILHEAGEVGFADLDFARANVEAARGEFAAAREALEQARIDLRTLVGGDGTPRSIDNDHLVPGDVEAAVALAVRDHPSARAGRSEAEALRHGARAAWSALGPRVDLDAGFGREREWGFERVAESEPDRWSGGFGVRLRMPLADMQGAARAREANAEARRADWLARDRARSLEREVRRAYAAHRGTGERLSSAKARIHSLAGALTATRAEYRVGLKTITDVTRVQVDLARARIAEAAIRHERAREAYAIGVLTGTAMDARLPELAAR